MQNSHRGMGRPGASTAHHKLGSNPHGYLPPAASVKSSSSGAGMDALCNVAAAAGGHDELTFHPAKQMVEVEAFSSIHDMIHAAILQFGPPATLRQIYAACQERGRIAYKRAGGSRLITENHNWKAQVRHALYKSGHFKRVEDNQDEWQVTASIANQEPSITTVTIFADDIGASGSVCGDASHVGALGDADGAGNGMQVTSHASMSTRGGRGGNASAGRGPGGGLAAATPRSTRSKRSRLPSEKYRNASARRASEDASREGSKEGIAVDYDKESESYAGQSYGDGEPSSAADTRSGFPGIGPLVSAETGDRRTLRSQLGKQNGHAGCSTEGGAETVGLEARAETPQAMEMCSSFSVPVPRADNKAEATATSGRSADMALSPDAKRSNDDITSSQGCLPMKKRLKAAAAESEQRASRQHQSAINGASQPKLEVKTDLPAEGPHQDDASKDENEGASKRNPNRNRRKPFRGSTPGSGPSSPTGMETNDDAAQLLDQKARSTRKQRGRPPKPGQTPGVTLRARHPPCTPHVDTPDMEGPQAITNATPTTQPTPATGITTRMSRRMSLQKSPAHSADQVSTESEGKLDRNCVKAAALVVLQEHKRPLTIKELAGAVVECGLAEGGLGRTTADHAVASTLYLDMEMCSTTPFREEDDGKFGLVEWGSAETHA